ncbi:hypothetical protein H0E87_010792 [Populus deltoides]|uniref:Secreted protein n=1 Tax=Populus deltoides TaxID=3696 RepID=A0A8T2YUC7_POPDE|nr:hypothetical protein H0E87_010792 [Populus deltoides]
MRCFLLQLVLLVVLSGWLAAGHDIEPSRGRCCCFLVLAFWVDGGYLLALDFVSSRCCSVVFLPQGCWMLLICCKGSLCLLRGIVWGLIRLAYLHSGYGFQQFG